MGHTVQGLAKLWKKRFASGVDSLQDAELVVQEAYNLIWDNCEHIKPELWRASHVEHASVIILHHQQLLCYHQLLCYTVYPASHVEHALCEVRKFKNNSTFPR